MNHFIAVITQVANPTNQETPENITTNFDRFIQLTEVVALPIVLPIALVLLTSIFALKKDRISDNRQRDLDKKGSLLDSRKRIIAAMYQLLTDVQLRHVNAQCSDLPDDQCVGLNNNELQREFKTLRKVSVRSTWLSESGPSTKFTNLSLW